jgi:hypothetical protein
LAENHIIALLEALCDRPFADDQVEPSAELQALCRAVLAELRQPTDEQPAGVADTFDNDDRAVAALAAVLSNTGSPTVYRELELAMARSPAIRLETVSALAFVDALERSPQTVPVYLLEELSGESHNARTKSAAVTAAAAIGLWDRFFGGGGRWRMAACTVLLALAGGLSWSLYSQYSFSPLPAGAPPRLSPEIAPEQLSIDKPPVQSPRPAAAYRSCDPQSTKRKAVRVTADSSKPLRPGKHNENDTGCGPDNAAEAAARAIERGARPAATAGPADKNGAIEAARPSQPVGAAGATPPAALRAVPPPAAPSTVPGVTGQPR